MPDYEPPKASKFGISILLGTLVSLFIFQPIYVVLAAVLVFFIIAWSLIEQPKIDRHFKELHEKRENLSICDFAKEFDARSTDTWVIRATYEQLQAALPSKSRFPIKASDKLIETLLLDEEDIDMDIINEIAQRSGRSLESCENNPYYGKISTVRSLVLFFNHQGCANAT